MSDLVPIHLRVPAAHKGRWIRASRAAGMRLSDWIIEAVEAHMQRLVIIPDDVQFSDLQMTRDPGTGDVEFELDPLQKICRASGLDITEPNIDLLQLISQWYRVHRAAGGEPDPVQEDLIAEARAEDAAGQPFSLPPGRA